MRGVALHRPWLAALRPAAPAHSSRPASAAECATWRYFDRSGAHDLRTHAVEPAYTSCAGMAPALTATQLFDSVAIPHQRSQGPAARSSRLPGGSPMRISATGWSSATMRWSTGPLAHGGGVRSQPLDHPHAPGPPRGPHGGSDGPGADRGWRAPPRRVVRPPRCALIPSSPSSRPSPMLRGLPSASRRRARDPATAATALTAPRRALGRPGSRRSATGQAARARSPRDRPATTDGPRHHWPPMDRAAGSPAPRP